MDIKLIALDMDGTLLDSKKQLPADFYDWVRKHTGIKTVIASGRQYYTLIKDFEDLQNELIFVAENGGLVFEKGNIIYCDEMKKEDVKNTLKIIEKEKLFTPLVCGANSAYMLEKDKDVYEETAVYYERMKLVKEFNDEILQDSIIKIAIFVRGGEAAGKLSFFDCLDDHLTSVLSGDRWIDVSNKSVNKGVAVTAIRERYGIKRQQSMAFGDYLNDVSLIESCEESYCMQNGHPELKKIAKHIADSNDDNGVMKVLYQL